MIVTMPSSASFTQTVAIKTDVQVANSNILCPITAVLTPSVLTPTAAYISLSADFTTISFDANQVVQPTDYGIHPFTLTVNSLNFSGSVPQ